MRSETGWPRGGWTFWIAAAAATAITLVCAANSLRWINRPFPGFFVWDNLFVPAVGDTDWTGYEAGIPYRSRLLTMDGQTLASAGALYARAAALPLGSAPTYELQPPEGPPRTLRIPTMRFDVGDYLWTLGNYLLVGVLLTLLGFAVFALRPDAPAARALWIACATWGLYLVTAADIFGPAWFRPLCLLLQALGPATLVHLALSFPVERAPLRRQRWLLPALYGAAALVGLIHNLVFHRSFAAGLAIDRINSVGLVVAGTLLIGLLADALLRPPSAAARQRTKLAALGGVASFVIPVAGFFVYYLLGVSFPLNFVTFSIVLFPLAIAYAIVQHDLFEVDAIIRRTLAWAILTALIAVGYLGGVGALEVLFTGRGGRLLQLAFLLAIVAVVNPLRDRVQAGVDRLFARERYDYRATVTRASQSLARLLDVDVVVREILHTIVATMRVEHGAVWLRGADGGYRRHAAVGAAVPADAPASLAPDDPLIRRLEAAADDILTDEPIGDPALAAGIAALRATLVVPMAFEERPLGFIALGGKASGRFYSGEDRGLLQTLASQGAMALENARSYQAVADANAELRRAQAQLIQAERFAAIGEVSAAVAHGIRNPLAGIKAAARVAGLELGAEHPARATIGDIVDESNRLEARIKALLDFAKPFEPHPAPCAVDEMVAEALRALRAQIQAQAIAVEVDIDPELPAAAVDRGQIVEVLLVLLSNAIEAMAGGGRLSVRARRSDDGRHLQLDVRDSGIGISPAQQARLFHLFATTKPTGTGLGLAVAKKIVERHGGRIGATSAPGEGTCFTVRLPL
ncbi:GAF domain-containing protein [bacterium]|nr:GAF domain-containing protein [bacterium]